MRVFFPGVVVMFGNGIRFPGQTMKERNENEQKFFGRSNETNW